MDPVLSLALGETEDAVCESRVDLLVCIQVLGSRIGGLPKADALLNYLPGNPIGSEIVGPLRGDVRIVTRRFAFTLGRFGVP